MTYEGDSHFDVGRMQSNLFATLQQLLFFYDIVMSLIQPYHKSFCMCLCLHKRSVHCV